MTTHEGRRVTVRPTQHRPHPGRSARRPAAVLAAAARTAAPPDRRESDPPHTPDVWAGPEPVETDERAGSITPADEIPKKGRGRRRGRGTSGKSARTKKSETIKAQERAARTVAKTRKSVKLELCGTAGHITCTPTTATAWFVQPPGPWNMRPTATATLHTR
ncbi:hypothetical protein GCM10020255_008410 [Rhodococcus baikonurensis]